MSKRKLSISVLLSLLMLMLIPMAVFATAFVHSGHSVRNNRLLLAGFSQYTSELQSGANIWNARTSKVAVQYLNGPYAAEVSVSDVNYPNYAWTGAYNTNGQILLNSAKLNLLSFNGRVSDCAHEIGHALGFAENTSNINNIMWHLSNGVVTPGQDDLDSLRYWGW